MKRWLAGIAILVVYALHQDFWNWRAAHPLVLGFIPVGLAYHAGFSICASLLMILLVKTVWPEHLEAIVDSGVGAHSNGEAHR